MPDNNRRPSMEVRRAKEAHADGEKLKAANVGQCPNLNANETACRSMDDDDFQWWPSHVQAMMIAIGRAIDGRKGLHPQMLRPIPNAFGSILPAHQVTIRHVSGREIHRRNGYYLLVIDGPIYGGRWLFKPSKLEKLSRSAAKARA